MHRDKVLLRQDAEETARHLADNITKLEERVTDGVKTMSPVSLIRRHPVSAIGAAALIGFAGTYWYRRVRPLAARLVSDFGPEIKLVLQTGAGFLLERISDESGFSEPT